MKTLWLFLHIADLFLVVIMGKVRSKGESQFYYKAPVHMEFVLTLF